jgi:hypothetical protein
VQEEYQAEVEIGIAVNFSDVSQEVDHPVNSLVEIPKHSF